MKLNDYWGLLVSPTRQFIAGCCAGFGFGLMVGSGPGSSMIFGVLGGGLIGIGSYMAIADRRVAEVERSKPPASPNAA